MSDEPTLDERDSVRRLTEIAPMSANTPTAVDPTEPIDRQPFGESSVRIVVDEATDEIAASAEYDSEADTPVSVELELPPGADPEGDLDSVDIQIRDEHSEADPENNTTPEANHD